MELPSRSGSPEEGTNEPNQAIVGRALLATTLEEEKTALRALAQRCSDLEHRMKRLQTQRKYPKWAKTNAKLRKRREELRKEMGTRASVEVCNDEQTMLAVLGVEPRLFDKCGKAVRSNKEVVLAALNERTYFNFRSASWSLRKNRRFVLQAVKKSSGALMFASAPFKKDLEVVRTAVKKDGTALRFANQSLRNSSRVVKTALKQTGLALRFASQRLQSKSRIVLRAVEQSGMALEFASEDLRNQEETAVAAVKKNGLALQFASTSLRSNRALVLAAVDQHGQALEFASADLRGDKEVVLRAVASSPMALRHASDDLRADADVVVAALRQQASSNVWTDPDVLQFAAEESRANPEVILEAVRLQPIGRRSLSWASQDLRKDKDFVLQAMRASPRCPPMLFLRQADASCLEQTPLECFHGACRSKLASRGEEAPVLSIRLAAPEPAPESVYCPGDGLASSSGGSGKGKGSGSGKRRSRSRSRSRSKSRDRPRPRPNVISSCEVTLLSGASFSCSLFFKYSEVFPKPSVPNLPNFPLPVAGRAADEGSGSSHSHSHSDVSSGSSSTSDDQPDPYADIRAEVGDIRQRTKQLCDSIGKLRQRIQLEHGSSYTVAHRISDLSHVVWLELQKQLEVRPFPERVSIIFLKADGTSVAVTPWDWRRRLLDFV